MQFINNLIGAMFRVVFMLAGLVFVAGWLGHGRVGRAGAEHALVTADWAAPPHFGCLDAL